VAGDQRRRGGAATRLDHFHLQALIGEVAFVDGDEEGCVDGAIGGEGDFDLLWRARSGRGRRGGRADRGLGRGGLAGGHLARRKISPDSAVARDTSLARRLDRADSRPRRLAAARSRRVHLKEDAAAVWSPSSRGGADMAETNGSAQPDNSQLMDPDAYFKRMV